MFDTWQVIYTEVSFRVTYSKMRMAGFNNYKFLM